MIGIELHIEGAPVVKACLEKKLLVNATQGTVIRLLPPMVLTNEQVSDRCARMVMIIILLIQPVSSMPSARALSSSSVYITKEPTAASRRNNTQVDTTS
jgi:hypothetical protein